MAVWRTPDRPIGTGLHRNRTRRVRNIRLVSCPSVGGDKAARFAIHSTAGVPYLRRSSGFRFLHQRNLGGLVSWAAKILAGSAALLICGPGHASAQQYEFDR